jgi:hypothetical protein
MEDAMSVMTTDLEQVFKTVDQLNDAELELLRQRIERAHPQKALTHSRGYPEEAAELFAIPFENYINLPDDERAAIAFRAYKVLDRWIAQELKARRARWMLVCGGEILESSPELIEYPAREKLMALGKKSGLIPFVFIYKPLIEESSWSAIDDSDYYPTLSIIVGRFGVTASKLLSEGVMVEADFDTGSPDLLLDYDQMISNGVVDMMPIDQDHFHLHLGEFNRSTLLPITVGVTDTSGQTVTLELGAVFVRNWRQSSLCFVNPSREALAGRNLLLKFPLKVELDDEKKTTKVIGKKAASKKSKKRK